MRCLYCGKELALLKRLRGGGEFCSDAHKNSYQEEYNRLGVSRLLQARKAGESQAAQKTPKVPVAEAPVAVADPAVEAVAVEKVEKKPARAPKPAPREVISAPEPAPPAMAGFALETPSISVPPETVPYLEPWLSGDLSSPPAPPPAPAWRLEGPSVEPAFFALLSAELLSLDVQAKFCDSGYPLMDIGAAPQETAQPRVNLSMPLNITWAHEFQAGGSVAIEIAPRPSESSCYASLNGALDFSYSVEVRAFDLMDLSQAGIAFPAEDWDVTLPDSWTDEIVAESPFVAPESPVVVPQVDLAIPPFVPAVDPPVELPVDNSVPVAQAEPSSEPAPEPPPVAIPAPDSISAVATPAPVATPRAALEALSKLHQDMREREEAVPAELPTSGQPDARVAVVEADAPPQAEASPREASELLAISIKSFAPPRPTAVIDATARLGNGHPLLPRLKGLPLRPKVAPTPRGFNPQSKATAPQNAPAEVKKPVSNGAPGTVEPAEKTAAPEKPAPKPPLAPPAKKAVPPPEAGRIKPPAPPTESSQPKPSPAQTKPEQAAKPVQVKSSPTAPKPQPAQPPKPEPAVSAPASPPKSEPVAIAPPAKKEPEGKVMAAAAASATSAGDHTVPNFGAVVNTSVFGSLKVKLGLGALIAVSSIGVYFVATAKSKVGVNPAKATDGAGPSIMVGEGGWVEGWAGDPAGLHSGRQITIYRPSLKLTDYRFEFQGQIENKSLGWIFRAADPENYYAVKLQLVSQELPLKLELYKYMVLKGRQVQVGRVPIEAAVKNDTVFSIRMDVRGPKFTTYIQGQAVDVWTDDQLRSGGVGFLNERSERGKVKSVSLSYLSGGSK